ncbi:hypothetical protein V1478_009091 [Vespula squamosa]|uniref:Uncharacterized protein n=1 Tax=Vespula squamosa TaxID=30214 RepID=A0ABD2ANM7_VESSQ
MEVKSRRRDTRVGGGSYGACPLSRQSVLLRGQIERARNRKASFESTRFHQVLSFLARRLDGRPMFKKGSTKESVKEFFCLITGKKLVTVTASNGVHTLLIYVRKGMTGRAIAPWPELSRSTASRKDSPIIFYSLTISINCYYSNVPHVSYNRPKTSRYASRGYITLYSKCNMIIDVVTLSRNL